MKATLKGFGDDIDGMKVEVPDNLATTRQTKPPVEDDGLGVILDKFATEVHKNKQHYIDDFESAEQQLLAWREAYTQKKVVEAEKRGSRSLSELTYTIDMLTSGDRKTAIHPTQQKLVDELMKTETEIISAPNQITAKEITGRD